MAYQLMASISAAANREISENGGSGAWRRKRNQPRSGSRRGVAINGGGINGNVASASRSMKAAISAPGISVSWRNGIVAARKWRRQWHEWREISVANGMAYQRRNGVTAKAAYQRRNGVSWRKLSA